MRPADVQIIGTELAIRWENGGESFIPLERLRRECPCAGCKGAADAVLRPESFTMTRLAPVGTYAVRPIWGDGHNSGIYIYACLQRLAAG